MDEPRNPETSRDPGGVSRRAFMKIAAASAIGVKLGLFSSSAKSADTKGNATMPATSTARARLDANSLKAIEMHSHIHTQAGIDLIRQEKLDYALLMWRGDDALLELARKNKDVVGLLYWGSPTQADYLAQAEAMVKQHGDIVRGFKLHPNIDKYTVSLDLLGGLFELANKLNLLIESHTDRDTCNSAKFARLMRRFRQTKLVLLHGYPAGETFELINAYDNVYVDMSSTAWGREFQTAALQAVGKKKIVLGLDSPIAFPEKDKVIQPHFRQAIGEIAEFYANDAAVLERVLYQNARDLLDSLTPATSRPA